MANSGAGLAPAFLAPGLLLFWGEECPSDKTALFLPLSHFNGAYFQCASFVQGTVNAAEVAGFGDQTTEPKHLLGVFSAFAD